MSSVTSDQRLFEFIHYLRAEDFFIGIHDSEQILNVLSELAEPDPQLTRQTIRSISCRNENEWHRFNHVFDHFWYSKQSGGAVTAASPSDSRHLSKQQKAISGIGGSSSENVNILGEESGLTGSGAGKQTTITKTDFRFITDPYEMQKMEHLAEKLALSLKRRLGRKYLYRKQGVRLDVRRTLRSNLASGGLPVSRIFKQRDFLSPRLVILHDVSHSMTWNNPLLFRFARGLVRAFKSCEAFAFHTELIQVTDIYKHRSLQTMRDKLEENNKLWLGGTCIAKSIQRFNQEFSASILKHDSIVIIISDGFDTDEPEELAGALSELGKKSKKVIWLSPVLNRQRQAVNSAAMPESMNTVMPFIDAILPADSLDSLSESLKTVRQFT